MAQLIMVEGLPGSGKSTTAEFLDGWLARHGWRPAHVPEGRTDHPVDLEQVAVLTTEELIGIVAAFPAHGDDLMRVAAKSGGAWLVRYGQGVNWPTELRDRLARHDAYDGDVRPELHREVLRASWRAFGVEAAQAPDVHVFECVLIQNPVSALMARFDESEAVITAHVRQLVDAVRSLNPVLVYLDPGEPMRALERAAAERPAEWLEYVIHYHCGQGYGLAHGLTGFDGYVEFMRRRREVELALLERLDVPTICVDVSSGDWDAHRAEITGFLTRHLARSSGGPSEVPLGA